MLPQFDTMNETDVREAIVRPLLTRLGYAHGTKANIRTEVTLRYARAFLGRKNKRKDPPLVGRADYVCEAVTFGRWVVEVKAPQDNLSQDDVEQAHTYCAHPEISATHFLLTNGREFRLYVTGDLVAPILSWAWGQVDEVLLALQNVLSYEAVVKRANMLRYDMAKPIGKGLGSRAEVISGEVHFGRFVSNQPQFNPAALEGSIASIVPPGSLHRDGQGKLSLEVGYRSPMQHLTRVIQAAGLDRYEFSSMDEYLSIDEAIPSIFQNFTRGSTAPGLEVEMGLGLPAVTLPIGFDFAMYSNAVVYFDGRDIRGTLDVAYDYAVTHTEASRRHPGFASYPDRISVQGEAELTIALRV